MEIKCATAHYQDKGETLYEKGPQRDKIAYGKRNMPPVSPQPRKMADKLF